MSLEESPITCNLFRAKSSQICGGCEEVFNFEMEYQNKEWSTHKTSCKPYQIVSNEKFGRCLVATRNLKPGEIIFGENATIVGPKQGCRPCCLKCFTSLDSVASLFRCPGCNFPFCQEQCAKSPEHEAECVVLSRARSCISINDMSKSHPVYQCITPLRGILLKNTQPKLFEAFSGLVHHNDLRRQTQMWRIYQVNIVQFLRNVCGLANQFSEEEIHAACGVLDVNAFEIRLPGSKRQQILGLFPIASMMSHRCVSNTHHVIDSNTYEMTVRASVPIKKGEQLFTTYTLPLDGTNDRRSVLRQSKMFECDCPRCSDPTECLTFLSALRCPRCPIGIMLPIRPLEENETEWQCSPCSYQLDAAVVTQLIDQLKEEFENIGPKDVDKLEEFLSRNASSLHPNHFLFTSVRQSLSQLYGRDERYLLNTLTMEQLERKVSICQQLLSVADVVEPGLTRLRGVTLYELYAPMLLLAKRTYEAGHCTLAEFKERIVAVEAILSEATKILLLEDPASTEGAACAVQALNQIQRWIASL